MLAFLFMFMFSKVIEGVMPSCWVRIWVVAKDKSLQIAFTRASFFAIVESVFMIAK